MMRLAYVCADQGVPVFGQKGCSIHVQEVVRAMAGIGAAVELFTPRHEGCPPAGLEDVTIHPLPIIRNRNQAAREQTALSQNERLRQELERFGPYDLVHERYSLWSFAGMEYATQAGVPGVLEVNAPLIEEQARYRGLVDRASAVRVARHAFAAATALIAVSREVAAYLEEYPETGGRIHVVPNGVNPNRFRPGLPPSLPGGPGEFTVGFVGSLKPWHGLETLVDAFELFHRCLPEARLLIVGEGPERANVEKRVSEFGLGARVHLTGGVAASDIPGLLASMNVAVAPYVASPNFYFSPLKVYEYMAVGLPVVASRMGQLAALIQHGVNGLLCTPDEPAELAGALEQLHCNAELRACLGQAARETVDKDHSWQSVVERIIDIAYRESKVSGQESAVRGRKSIFDHRALEMSEARTSKVLPDSCLLAPHSRP
jgi:glycosyltransferase involved in cell wall biosynthesis